MSVVSVRKLYTGRNASQNIDGNMTTNATYEVVFNHVANENDAANAEDPAAGGDPNKIIPLVGSVHPYVTRCYAVSVDPEPSDESPYIWYVNVAYDSKPAAQNPAEIDSNGNAQPGEKGQQNQNPLARPATWTLGSIDRQEVVRQWIPVGPDGEIEFTTPANWFAATPYKRGAYVKNGGMVYYCIQAGTSVNAPTGIGDENGIIIDDDPDTGVVWEYVGTVAQVTTDPNYAISKACTNSGKAPFDPANMTDVSIPTITFSKNVAIDKVTLDYVMKLKNAVNLKTWKKCKPRTLKVMKLSAQSAVENDVSFVQFSVELGFDPDTWDTKAVDAGYGSIQLRTVPNPAAPPATIEQREFTAFIDSNGEKVDHPVPMDGRGGMLKPDDEPVTLRGIPVQQKLLDFAENLPF